MHEICFVNVIVLKTNVKLTAMKRIALALFLVALSTFSLSAQTIFVENGLYVDGDGHLFTGQYTEHFSTGTKKSEINIIKGKADGFAIYFYENGNKMESGRYLEGLRDGLWEKWNETGMKTGEANYKSGVKDGTWIVWNDNGKEIMEMHYCKGEKCQTWKMWDENGTLTGERTYSESQ
jgi:antitoxin component YwqK of YwqJK toxin-antitoxin module